MKTVSTIQRKYATVPFSSQFGSELFGNKHPYPGLWPARWIHHFSPLDPPFTVAYRLHLTIEKEVRADLLVSADERYILYVDGTKAGRGPERGDRSNWHFETYDLTLSPGDHVLVAVTWAMGDLAPYAQISVKPGFICASTNTHVNTMLATGSAPWESSLVDGVSFHECQKAWLAGGTIAIDGTKYPFGISAGKAGSWQAAKHGAFGVNSNSYDEWGAGVDGHLLAASELPALIEQPIAPGIVRHCSIVNECSTQKLPYLLKENNHSLCANWQDMLSSAKPVTIAAGSTVRILIDLDNYYCAYYTVIVSGGRAACVHVRWSEALYVESHCYDHASKGNRNEIDGKFFGGVEDKYVTDGGERRIFENSWFRAGRFVELVVSAAEEPLTIESFVVSETRYPLEMQSSFSSSDTRYSAITPVMFRSLQMCSHDTFFDCPYYEQMMYIGDTRLQALITFCTSRDDRLVRKALGIISMSRLVDGLTQSRYPARSIQVIPPFSLWWCAMIYDYALWKGDKEFVRPLMSAAGLVIDRHLQYVNDGLLGELPGWNFMDWTGEQDWVRGAPPRSDDRCSCMINWQFVMVLKMLARVAQWLDEPEVATRYERIAKGMAIRINMVFWDERKKLFADDSSKTRFSEHSQCMAILSEELPQEQLQQVADALVGTADLVRTTIYFSHYLFEALRMVDRAETISVRMSEWFNLVELGMRTTRENPEPARSDCHAWGAHPLYHYYATIAGIRPSTFGFESVDIHPADGFFGNIQAVMPHRSGDISVDYNFTDKNTLRAVIILPEKCPGTFSLYGQLRQLNAGVNEFVVHRTC